MPRPARPNRWLNGAIPSAVQAAVGDPSRLSPMLAGGSCIRHRGKAARLVVRTAAADIEVDAPGALLEKVFQWCDGTRTVDEALAACAGDAAERAEMADFIAFLLSQGALIDANLACAHAASYAFQFSPFGLAAPAADTDPICRRFLWNADAAPATRPAGTVRVPDAPLAPWFAARVTQYTFDDRAPSAQSLHQLLWSLAGVVQTRHPRIGLVTPQRTLASAGGMHLLQVYVALRRPVGRWAPGVYRVDYPEQKAISLRRVGGGIDLLPLAFGKPWELTFATGAVFLAADPVVAAMRYRSRSLQYLFMEAGAALHNGALSADALGLGYATIGGYYERPIARLCGLGRELVLGSALFGAKAAPEQLALVAHSPDIDFAWVNGDSAKFSMRFHLARAKVKTADDDRPHTWGRDTDPWRAMQKAIGEAVEREGFRQPRGIVTGRLAQVAGALDPARLVRYSPAQYEAPGFPYRPFAPEQACPWATGVDLVRGEPVRVLAELVFSRASLAAQGHAMPQPCTQVTSSGCAAGVTMEEATHRGLLEVIERDAFMRHWLSQTPGEVVPEALWPRAIARRVQPLVEAGCRVVIQKLDVRWAHVALVAVQHHGQHFTTMGTAACSHFSRAAEGALDEAEARVYAWLHGHAPSISRPEEVSTTEHHFELYGLRRHYRRADRVLFPTKPAHAAFWPRPHAAAASLDALARRFAAAGLSPIAVDITPANHHVDQGRTPLSVAKVLVPGLLPISFGYQREPLGMVPRIHPGAKFPHPFP
jgi:ribosomal protein S12 methylthiotransferase accessory factor